MKRIYRLLALLLALCLTTGLLTGCDEDPNDEEKLSVVMTGLFTTMDPAMAATAAERTVVLHVFDNLLRWDGEKSVSAVALPSPRRRGVVRRQPPHGGGLRLRLEAPRLPGHRQPQRRHPLRSLRLR